MARLLAVLVLAVLAVPAAAQDMAALGWMTGTWRGGGNMFGSASEAVLEVRPALGGRFVEFSYRAGQFEGRAFYRPSENGRWQATWFDNRGVSFGIDAGVESNTLTSDWGIGGTERGRTVYRLLGDGRLEVVDTVMQGAQPREFARHVLTRTD